MNKKGSTGWIVLGVFVVIILMIAMFWAGSYNSLVTNDENVRNSWGKVQSAYQRRADLIPNLVETVKGARDFEQGTLTEIAALRSQAGNAQQKAYNADTPEQMQEAGNEMNSVLSRLMVIVEAYPTLTATENFRDLQVQLEGTENRIKWERDNYNDAVMKYKVTVRRFPTNIIAGMSGFYADEWDMFEAEAGSEVAPDVTFD